MNKELNDYIFISNMVKTYHEGTGKKPSFDGENGEVYEFILDIIPIGETLGVKIKKENIKKHLTKALVAFNKEHPS